MKITRIYTLAVLLAAAPLLSGAPAAMFHSQFDQDFHALGGPGGSTPGKHSQETLWETLAAYMRPGISGNAAIIGASQDKKQGFNIVYPAKDIIHAEQGAVAFWIQPLDWDVSDKNYHVFFRAQGPDADLLIYKVPNDWGCILRFLIGPSRTENGRKVWTEISADVRKWKRGDWHFIVASWGKNRAALYIDGVLAKEQEISKMPGDFTRFGAGGLYPTKWSGNPGTSLIDELMIYNVMLTPKDVRERYSSYGRGFLGGDDTTPANPERLVTLVNQQQGIINVQFEVNHSQSDGSPFEALVEFADPAGKAVWQKRFVSDKPRYILPVPEKEIPCGDYQIKVTLYRKNGQTAGKGEMFFRRPQRPEVWEGNTLGCQNIVPPPWTPMQWDGQKNAVNCWNRSCVFGKSLLPEQIHTGQMELFTSPVRLLVNGKSPAAAAAVKAVKTAPEAIDLTAGVSEGDFDIRSAVHAEFDGFIWFDLTLTPKKAEAEIRNLVLEFPFRKENSTLFNSMTKYYLDYKPGAYGAFKSFAMDLYRVPRVIFVGNDHGGLEWVCETMSDWRNLRPQESLQLIPGAKENLLRLNLIDHPVKIGKALTYSFGIQATPVRPLPKKWRLMRAGSKKGDGFTPFWEATVRHNSLNPEHLRPNYEQERAKIRKIYGRELLYLAGFTNTPFYKEWPYWCLTWSKTTPEAGFYGAVNNPREIFAWNCPVPTERDWYLWYLDNFMKKYHHQDLYFDNQCAQLCSNTIHGCGFRDSNGNLWPTYNLRATRALTKRIYILQKTQHPEALIMRHMSSKAVTPTISFADFWLDGELFCKTVGVDEDYKNIFSPEMFRACFRSENYGVPNYYIPQFQRAIRWHSPIAKRYERDWNNGKLHLYRDKLRHFLGYIAVHDALAWQYMGVNCEKLWDIQDCFGFNGEERFIMYNDPANPFGYAQRLLMVSCYILEGRAMIVVMNDTGEPVTSLTFDAAKFARLGVKVTELKDAETMTPVTLKGQTIQCDVPARNYRIFLTGVK